jgi:hypothetical protein
MNKKSRVSLELEKKEERKAADTQIGERSRIKPYMIPNIARPS